MALGSASRSWLGWMIELPLEATHWRIVNAEIARGGTVRSARERAGFSRRARGRHESASPQPRRVQSLDRVCARRDWPARRCRPGLDRSPISPFTWARHAVTFGEMYRSGSVRARHAAYSKRWPGVASLLRRVVDVAASAMGIEYRGRGERCSIAAMAHADSRGGRPGRSFGRRFGRGRCGAIEGVVGVGELVAPRRVASGRRSLSEQIDIEFGLEAIRARSRR